MDRSLPMRGRKRPNSPHPAIIPESSRFGLVALAVTLLFLWTALTSQTILRLHHSNHTRLRSGGLKVNGEDRKLVVHAARNGFFYALDRTNGSFVAGKQYVDELTWTPGLDPKTGKPLNYDPTKDVQVYAPGSHGMRGEAPSKTCPSHHGGKNREPSAY